MKLSDRGIATIFLIMLFVLTYVGISAIDASKEYVEAVIEEVMYG